MPEVPFNEMSRLYPHAPKTIAAGWHVAWGSRGPLLRRDADYQRHGHQARLWETFDVTRKPGTTYGFSDRFGDHAIVTTSTHELVCSIVAERTAKGERFRYRLPNGYLSRLYRSWVEASRVAWEVMHAHDPNIGLPLPARVHGLADGDAAGTPLPAPRAVRKAVTRPAVTTQATTTTTSPTTTARNHRRDTDHGGYHRTSGDRQASSRARGGSDHLVFDATERCDSGADDQ